MKKVQIISDSCSDLSADLRKKFNIDYVKMGTIHNEKEAPASLDWEYYSNEEMYEWLRQGDRITTTQVTAGDFTEIFEKYASENTDIVYIGCAGALSGSVNVSLLVKKQLAEKYPDVKIICIDSVNSCMGEGMLAVEAAKMAAEGKTADEIAEVIEKMKYTINQFCTVSTLDYFKRAGRVKGSTAFFGNLFGVKPIVISDEYGNNVAYKKVKGRDGSMREIVRLTAESTNESSVKTLYLGHAVCEEDGKKLAEYLHEALPDFEIYTFVIGPIIGSTTGPGALVIYSSGRDIRELPDPN